MLTVKELLQATGGSLRSGNDTAVVKRVCIDSRAVRKGDLFVAIKGPRFDGHDFIKAACAQGASAVMAADHPGVACGRAAVIVVEDTVRALGVLARSWRDRFRVHVIAVTGSAGKTTTKNLLAAALRSRKSVLFNQGSFNNHIGVPLTLLQLKPEHQVAVIEMGTNQPGDIAWLAFVARPDSAVLTNIGESHLEKLKSPQFVFREKARVLKGLAPHGRVWLNKDDYYLKKLYKRGNNDKIVSYAVHEEADYRAGGITYVRQGLSFRVNGRHDFVLKTPVAENVYNALAAVSCARFFGVPYQEIARNLRLFQFEKQRQSVRRLGKIWLIDDTYNANPVSMRSAVKTLSAFPTKGRKIVVCGDMLELGGRAKALHREMGAFMAGKGLDRIFAYGPLSRGLAAAVRESRGSAVVGHYTDLDALHQALGQDLQAGDVVLVKGSRGMRLERTVAYLNKKAAGHKPARRTYQ